MNKIILWGIKNLIDLFKRLNPEDTIGWYHKKKFIKDTTFESFNSIKVNIHEGIASNIKEIEKHTIIIK